MISIKLRLTNVLSVQSKAGLSFGGYDVGRFCGGQRRDDDIHRTASVITVCSKVRESYAENDDERLLQVQICDTSGK